jgi:hypothetical protein
MINSQCSLVTVRLVECVIMLSLHQSLVTPTTTQTPTQAPKATPAPTAATVSKLSESFIAIITDHTLAQFNDTAFQDAVKAVTISSSGTSAASLALIQIETEVPQQLQQQIQAIRSNLRRQRRRAQTTTVAATTNSVEVPFKVTKIPTKDTAAAIQSTLVTVSASSAILREYKSKAAVTDATSIAITLRKKPSWFTTKVKLGISIGGAIIGLIIAFCVSRSVLIACKSHKWCSSVRNNKPSRCCISSKTITDIDTVIADLGDIVEVSKLGVHFSPLWQELGSVCWDGLGDVTKDIPYIRIIYKLCNQVVKMFEPAAENQYICENAVELARQMQVSSLKAFVENTAALYHKEYCFCDLKMSAHLTCVTLTFACATRMLIKYHAEL